MGGPWSIATIAAFAWKESAFIALVVVASVSRRLHDLLEASSVLGASRRQRWRRVFLPLATPPLAASSLIVFVYVVGSYEVPWLLGRSYPEPLPVMAYRLFSSIDLAARPQAAAAAAVGVAVALTCAIGALAAAGRRRSRS